MNLNELSTVQYYGLPIIIVVFNNGTLGMVRQWQTLTCNGRYSETTLDRGPDFVKLAQAYGLKGCRVTEVAELEVALEDALAGRQAAVIDCVIDINEMVRPMVGGGSDITRFMVD
jgi:acetolactate synthase-1/2/3 large subunit